MNSSPLRRQVRDRPVLRSLQWMVTVSSSRPAMQTVRVERYERRSGRRMLEHGLFAVAPGGDVEDPLLSPHGLRDDEIGTLSAQEVPEFCRAPICREP